MTKDQIEVYRAILPKDRLSRMAEAPRAFLLKGCAALNELNTLSNLCHLLSRDVPQGLLTEARAVQTNVLLRAFAAKLAESAELISTQLVPADWFEALRGGAHYPREVDAALESLKEHWLRLDKWPKKDKDRAAWELTRRKFRSQEGLRYLRNKFAFHYTDPEAVSAANSLDEIEEELALIFGPNNLNNLFYAGEQIMTYSLLSKFGRNPMHAYPRLFRIVDWFHDKTSTIFGGVVAALIQEDPLCIKRSDLRPIQVKAPALEACRIPYFFRVQRRAP